MSALILASNSPRRSELIDLLELPFEVYPADIDENQQADEPPVAYVQRMACQKALVIADDQPGLIIAADTIVVDGDELLGKPAHPAEARRMLGQLRGRVHQVYTHIAIVEPRTGQTYDAVCATNVPMRDYSDAEIDAYTATGDPMDKAGAYGIQNAVFHPVEGLHGCFASVMGLPLCHLAVGLRVFGVRVTNGLPERCQAFLNYRCPVFDTILGTF
jgi:MAF protein